MDGVSIDFRLSVTIYPNLHVIHDLQHDIYFDVSIPEFPFKFLL